MKPPYEITPAILKLITEISEKLGEIKVYHADRPSPQLRKQNRVRTIHASLGIEGNTLSQEQITAIIDNKRVLGPKEDILEVTNAIEVYNKLSTYDPYQQTAFLEAHQTLMKNLIDQAGQYRKGNVGIMHGSQIAHMAPPAASVPNLMYELFNYLKTSQDQVLIKSCVFHYEVEFIHPFTDGNGRMGRLWQSVLLASEYPVFAYLPFETLIKQNQDGYYSALAQSDNEGKSTKFIAYMLGTIDASLTEYLTFRNRPLSRSDRLEYFVSLSVREFSRKEYMNVFKGISTSTASRDLAEGVKQGLFSKTGDKRNTRYYLLIKSP